MSSDPPPPQVCRLPAGDTVQVRPLKLPALPDETAQLKRSPTAAEPGQLMVRFSGVGGGGGGGAGSETLIVAEADTGVPVAMSVVLSVTVIVPAV